MTDTAAEVEKIRDLVDKWSIFSDAGEWERFAECWFEDGFMCATWFQAPAMDFVAARRKGWENGVNIIHLHGGFTCDVKDTRAVSQTKMTIGQRARVHDVPVDVVCTGRFYDFFEKREGRWGIVRRQPIYEKDRFDPVDPSAVLKLDTELLERFPEGYRHLAYLQSKNGFKIKTGLPNLRGPAVEKLYAEGKAWLAGSATPGEPL